MSAKKCAINWIVNNKARVIEVSDKVWGLAELGLVEFKSSKLIGDELEKHGFRVKREIAGMPTAFIASWGEGAPVIGIMGEYDALPGLSQKKIPRQ
ncbi:amidohydrolase, partial [Candidatus Bathyarchaeota archaeon]|nr:amidohydrolase [Candidatus Bathyarchaeota archaeon]